VCPAGDDWSGLLGYFIRVEGRPAGDDWTLFQDDPYLGDLLAPPTSQEDLIKELLTYLVEAIMWDG
jgi:hypothetical protein